MNVKNTNALSNEKSPYLLQHQHNPVNWYPWGDEAFSKARSEQKPIFLSIGYSTCYWCHVMERDSFENQTVADYLNEHFIAIKVDREERPDIDKIYMDAVIAMTGQGGWPLSALLTPELKPFFCGTFFPHDQFLQLLNKVTEAWTNDRERVLESAEGITTALDSVEPPVSASEISTKFLQKFFRQCEQTFDSDFGGFGQAPKFPQSQSLSALLRIHRRTGSQVALHMCTKTLDCMARGGMYDHLGGGFARYSVDHQWLVPHFEKMLYDNALLARTYLEAYQVTKNEMYSSIAREILSYIEREMLDGAGGFYSAQDAGDVGKEGEYYVWGEVELHDLLTSEEVDHIRALYGVSPQGNFENNFNVLSLQDKFDWEAKKDSLTQSIHKKLLKTRSERRPPHKDDKILTSWNALMLSAYAKAYQVLGDEEYLSIAVKNASFLKENLYKNARLFHRFRDGETKFTGLLEDYAYLIQALIDLYECTFDLQWITWAKELQETLDTHFWDSCGAGYYFTETGDDSILIRKKDWLDNATPSGNGVSALNLLRLFHLTFEEKYLSRAEELLKSMRGFLEQFPAALSSTLIALDFYLDNTKECCLVHDGTNPDINKLIAEVWREFLPNKVIAAGLPADVDESAALGMLRGRKILNELPTFYICQTRLCKEPTNDPETALKLLREVKRWEIF